MDIFVKKDAEIVVDVFVWEKDSIVNASNLQEEIPQKAESKVIQFVFRKPSYKDSSRIMKKAKLNNVGITAEGSSLSADVMGMQDEMLRSQLIKIIDGDQEIAVYQEIINALEPAIARAAIAAVFDKTGI